MKKNALYLIVAMTIVLAGCSFPKPSAQGMDAVATYVFGTATAQALFTLTPFQPSMPTPVTPSATPEPQVVTPTLTPNPTQDPWSAIDGGHVYSIDGFTLQFRWMDAKDCSDAQSAGTGISYGDGVTYSSSADGTSIMFAGPDGKTIQNVEVSPQQPCVEFRINAGETRLIKP